MKIYLFMTTIILIIILSGCDNSNGEKLIIPIDNYQEKTGQDITIEVTRLVTRIIKIYPSSTPTIKPTPSCFDTARTQYDLNQCAISIEYELKIQMDKLVTAVAGRYSDYPEKKEEFLQLQSYWQINAKNECYLWFGLVLEDPETGKQFREYGTMAPYLVATCMIEKYNERIKELDFILNPY